MANDTRRDAVRSNDYERFGKRHRPDADTDALTVTVAVPFSKPERHSRGHIQMTPIDATPSAIVTGSALGAAWTSARSLRKKSAGRSRTCKPKKSGSCDRMNRLSVRIRAAPISRVSHSRTAPRRAARTTRA